jgi:hypothetical protein
VNRRQPHRGRRSRRPPRLHPPAPPVVPSSLSYCHSIYIAITRHAYTNCGPMQSQGFPSLTNRASKNSGSLPRPVVALTRIRPTPRIVRRIFLTIVIFSVLIYYFSPFSFDIYPTSSSSSSPSSGSGSSGSKSLSPKAQDRILQKLKKQQDKELKLKQDLAASGKDGRPYWEAVRMYEKNLPQHNLSLPYPEGKTGRYLRFSSQIKGLGWNNVLTEMYV